VVVGSGGFAAGEGPTGLGFDTAGGSAGFEVTTYKANVTVDSLAVAEQVISDPAKQSWTATRSGVAVIDYENTDTPGHFAYWTENADKSFPGTTWTVNSDDLVVEATAQVIIPRTGDWTFGVHSDEGFSLQLTKGNHTFSFSYPDTRTAADSLETFEITEAGIYDLRLVYFERSFGAGVELFAAEGSYTTFTPGVFQLVGDAAHGGLSTGGFHGVIQTDVSDLMFEQNATIWVRIPFEVTDPTAFDSMTLRMRYNDAFVAYLNGVEIARSNGVPDPLAWNSQATAARPVQDSVQYQVFGVSDFVGQLRAGTNVLAIHGLNVSPDDSTFLLSPELFVSGEQGFARYFGTPSPGGPNLASFADFVAPLQFSLPHGIYDKLPEGQYYELAITTDTPNALIYYTLDGSEPSPTNGILYGAPIQFNQTTIVRAVGYRPGYEPSKVVTQTYLVLEDVIYQSPNGEAPGPGWPTGSVNGQVINYGMDPDIVNPNPQAVIDALKAIPTISMVTDLDYLFDPSIGIFVNARKDAGDWDPWEEAVKNWERPASIELIYPDDASGPGFPDGADEGFQVNAGVRIRGGYSRQDANPKHAFRLFFRDEYGDPKLHYPLFGDEGAEEFDAVDLATSQNYSWAFGGPNNNTMIRDMVIRDLQGILGQPYTRSRFYHLYIDGVYWGIYYTQERSEADYGETYLGGEEEDYDAIHQNDSRVVYATDGNMNAYMRLRNMVVTGDGLDDNADYFRAQGLNPDGTPNPAYERLLDVDNLIDFMILTYYPAEKDGPGSHYTRPRPNNYWAVYNRENPDGFKFFKHDNEHSFGLGTTRYDGGTDNLVYPFIGSQGGTTSYFNAHWLHEELMGTNGSAGVPPTYGNAEYRMRFADRVYELFFNNGLLTDDKVLERINYRAAQIDQAIIAESARWGDRKTHPPKDRDDWLQDVQEIRDWVTDWHGTGRSRTEVVIDQLKAVGWWPTTTAPTLSQYGGQVDPGFQLTIGAQSGAAIYYTLDGSDPRAIGGAAVGTLYTGPISLSETAELKVRALKGGVWSPLVKAQFYVGDPASSQNLAITELNYHPHDPTAAEQAALPPGSPPTAPSGSFSPASTCCWCATARPSRPVTGPRLPRASPDNTSAHWTTTANRSPCWTVSGSRSAISTTAMQAAGRAAPTGAAPRWW